MNFEQLKVSEIKNFLDNLDMEDENIDKILNELSLDGRVSVQKLVMQFKNRYNNLKQNQLMNEEFYNFDRKYVLNNNYVIVGCDEVGRGPLAGPIVCASVVLDLYSEDKVIKNINDSKKIKSRDFKKKWSEIIKEKARSFKLIEITYDEIDRIGIGVANQNGLKQSVEGINTNVDLVLSDGYLVKGLKTKNISIIKGDTKSASIMCASIIAKVYRDELMIKYHEEFPEYDFLNNVGYGTKSHVEAIEKYGICKYHRKSFLKKYI